MSRASCLALVVAASLLAHAKGFFSPPLDYHHHRQVNTAAIARNYHRNGLNILKPQVDWEGPYRGLAATELPVYMWLVGLLWPLGGLGAVWGRVLSMAFSALTAVYLFRFVEKDAGRKAAFWAATFFSCIPLEIYFGRTIQPEAAALCGTMAALFHWRRAFSDEARPWDWPAAVLAAFLAIGMKLPFIFILAPLAFIAWQKLGPKSLLSPKVLAAPLLALGATYAWYRYASTGSFVVPTKSEDFLFMLEYARLPYFAFFQFSSRFPELAATYGGLVLGWFGARELVVRSGLRLYAVWWTCVALSLLAGGGYTFHHEYTSLPFAPVNAAFMGAGAVFLLERLRSLPGERRRWATAGLALLFLSVPIHATLRIKHWYKQNYSFLSQAAAAADSVSSADDLFLANERAASVFLYYLDRRGWSWDLAETGESSLSKVERRIQDGAKFFATEKAGSFADKNGFFSSWFYSRFPVVYDDDGLLIFKLR
jgi:4-amino-4-deoxy-L-arabinose transferase-like glycosyltransferase